MNEIYRYQNELYNDKKKLRADLNERLPSALFCFLLSKAEGTQKCRTVKFSCLCGCHTLYLQTLHLGRNRDLGS